MPTKSDDLIRVEILMTRAQRDTWDTAMRRMGVKDRSSHARLLVKAFCQRLGLHWPEYDFSKGWAKYNRRRKSRE